jgi:uncharacterized protein Yka (UPF0111/DUF47 family)
MNTKLTSGKGTYFFRIDVIKSIKQLREAFKHNKREIQRELGARSHIDAERIHLNKSLIDDSPTDELMLRLLENIDAYEEHGSKRIRREAVLALEVVFSLPAMRSDIDPTAYFNDCLVWVKGQLAPAAAMTAHIHLDESCPHMHVIMLCVTPTKLIGSYVKGDRRKYLERSQDFFNKVAEKYGFTRAPEKLRKVDKIHLANQVISHAESSGDPMTKSPHYSLIKETIRDDPILFANNLGIEIRTTPAKMRTSTQIMTSKGKGSNWQSNE